MCNIPDSIRRRNESVFRRLEESAIAGRNLEMTINDPNRNQGYTTPVRRDNTAAWIGGVIAVLVIIGLIWWAVEANRTNTASNPSSQTAGQSTSTPAPTPSGK